MAEESVYLKTKKIRLLSIDRLLEGEALVSVAESLLRITDLRSNIFFFHLAKQFNNNSQKHAITIPPIRNSRT